MTRPRARLLLWLVLAAVGSGPGCATKGGYFRVEDIPEAAPDDALYRIRPGDVIGIRVWNQATMSVDRARVRDDGNVSVPFLQDVEAAGMTPGELAGRLQVRLQTYIVAPVVTVTLEDLRPVRVSVLGEVTKPGAYDLDHRAGVLQAIAAAGGMTDYAHRDRIFVIRSGHWADGDPSPARIRFRFAALSRGERPAATFRLRSGDVVVVE